MSPAEIIHLNERPWSGVGLEACYHGGAFFEAIGPEFNMLDRRHDVISADVLDAWFPPAPPVTEALRDHLPWLLRTSPPTHAEGLVRVIARTRGVPPECLLPGAGSSDLIFLALRQWLHASSRVLMLDPTYGEYAHVCEKVIGCQVDRLELHRAEGFRLDLERLEARCQDGYDLVVLVNPNNPTGQAIPREDLDQVLKRLPSGCRCWIDEAYIEYAASDESLEHTAATSANVIVCKSLSKAYALSGVRAAYLVAGAETIRELRLLTPPWAVSLPAQVAAVHAMQAPDYYEACYATTHELRERLAAAIRRISPDGEVITGVGNWVLWYPGRRDLSVAELIHRCRSRRMYLREIRTGADDAVRIAVKDESTQERMISILQWALEDVDSPSTGSAN